MRVLSYIKLMVVFLLATKFCVAQQDSTPKTDFALTALRSMKLSGYTQLRYTELPQNSKPDGFAIVRARLDLKGAIDKKWDYRLQADFAGASAKLIDGTLKYRHSDQINITGGQFKIPFSVENLIPSSKLEFINRSQVVQSLVARTTDVIGNQNGRDIGVQVNGALIKIKDINLVEYWLGGFNGQGINGTDLNSAKDFCGRILFQPVKGLKAGGASYIGYDKIGTGNAAVNQVRNRYGFEANYTTSRIIAQSEYIIGKDGAVDREGYYVFTGYTFAKKQLQALIKFDYFDPDTDKEDNATSFYCAGLNYFINDNVKLQANYEIHQEEGISIDNDVIMFQAQIQF